MCFAGRIAQMVHGFAHEVRHTRVPPEHAGDKPDAVFRGTFHDIIEQPEIPLGIADVLLPVLAVKTAAHETYEGYAVGAQSFESLTVRGVFRILQPPAEGIEIIDTYAPVRLPSSSTWPVPPIRSRALFSAAKALQATKTTTKSTTPFLEWKYDTD